MGSLLRLFENKILGVAGFEPATSSSRTKRASQTALYPDIYDAAVPSLRGTVVS